MSARPIVAILILVAAATTPSIARQAAKTTVEFKVTDAQGAPIRDAVIRIIPSPDPSRLSFETDARGVRIVEAGTGDYSFTVSASGFARYTSAFAIANDSHATPEIIKVSMRVGEMSSAIVEPWPPANELRVVVGSDSSVAAVLLRRDLHELQQKSVKVQNLKTGKEEQYSGASLLDVLFRAGALPSREIRFSSSLSFVVAKGNSGDSAILALSEIDPSTSNLTAIVADSLNGLPLSDNLGPFRLILSNDKTLARSVRILNSIRIDYAR